MSFRDSSRRATNAPAATRPRAAVAGRPSIRPGVRVPMTTASSRAHQASRIDRSGAISPAESVMSTMTSATAGAKRKERDFEADTGAETGISVVVRCRGRSEREVRENSAVVVVTEGIRGNMVGLSMGPSALSNKSYNFDHVFSPAADQNMIFEDVVKPILDEMLTGYNCTIFAYGQTGTGKTYTMSGDMTEGLGILTTEAGIIPRVLQSLFQKIDTDSTDSAVHCSFIELYNEELKDLLSADEGAKLKIYDNTRRGHSTTMVQGVEERHITSAAEGIRRLQEGSLRRQVAATKCNDLSSRSHTVFNITVRIKRVTDDGKEVIHTGKLNLVDLAGSENIQRSGAENKRAAEAGLINKSLLTLGRVINALVDQTAHVPYRESKLTRLLQDSLGGRTKTCIIATISPAKSNLEETISTLDYAFRAKNIRNKPQVNQLIDKKTLLREFVAEIEKLKSDLITARARNGVYLSNEVYEEITIQSESRRILIEEQAAKVSAIENNLRNKAQELFHLISDFTGLKKEHEGTKVQLNEAQEVLDQTELMLTTTRKILAEETHIRKAHQATEEKLTAMGSELITVLNKTVDDVGELYAKNRRKSDLQRLNRGTWSSSQDQVAQVTRLVEGHIKHFRQSQDEHISSVSKRLKTFMAQEFDRLSSTKELLDEQLFQFDVAKQGLLSRQEKTQEEMDAVLEEIKTVRDHIKERVGESLQAIASTAERIAVDVASELDTFHNQLHASYSSIGKDVESTFESLLTHLNAQRTESDGLRRQLEVASQNAVQSNNAASTQIQSVVEAEQQHAAMDRHRLLAQIVELINTQAAAQESRLASHAGAMRESLTQSTTALERDVAVYSSGMDAWNEKEDELAAGVQASRDTMKTRMTTDWDTAKSYITSIQNTTKSVHAETVRVVDEQMKDLDVQMRDLDELVTRGRSQNATHHEQHATSMTELSAEVTSSCARLRNISKDAHDSANGFAEDVHAFAEDLHAQLEPLEEQLCEPLSDLREEITHAALHEYVPTGQTPERVQYQYPTGLPRTEPHDALLTELNGGAPSPSRAMSVFNDMDAPAAGRSPSRPASSSDRGPLGISLREMHPNVTTGSIVFNPAASTMSSVGGGGDGGASGQEDKNNHNHTMPLLRRSRRSGPQLRQTAVKAKGPGVVSESAVLEGRENIPPTAVSFEGSLSRRKSPRLK